MAVRMALRPCGHQDYRHFSRIVLPSSTGGGLIDTRKTSIEQQALDALPFDLSSSIDSQTQTGITSLIRNDLLNLNHHSGVHVKHGTGKEEMKFDLVEVLLVDVVLEVCFNILANNLMLEGHPDVIRRLTRLDHVIPIEDVDDDVVAVSGRRRRVVVMCRSRCNLLFVVGVVWNVVIVPSG